MARGDIVPLNAGRKPFFVKMWPTYETESETPDLNKELYQMNAKVSQDIAIVMSVILITNLDGIFPCSLQSTTAIQDNASY